MSPRSRRHGRPSLLVRAVRARLADLALPPGRTTHAVGARICTGTGLTHAHICTGTGLTPCHICSGTGLAPCHICAGTGLTPVPTEAAAPGTDSMPTQLRSATAGCRTVATEWRHGLAALGAEVGRTLAVVGVVLQDGPRRPVGVLRGAQGSAAPAPVQLGTQHTDAQRTTRTTQAPAMESDSPRHTPTQPHRNCGWT